MGSGEETEEISGGRSKEDILRNVLQFEHSFGYDCRKYFNLCAADSKTLAFASGVYMTFYDVERNKVWFHIGRTEGGIAHITKNHMFDHLAVAENGKQPLITIYKWPSMEVVTTLYGGTTNRYFCLAYSPDGLLLVSQGGEPDYWITVWNWKESKICLQCKSHVENVYNISFAQSVPGYLTTCGTAHIKFWKMFKTFTGLKLKGQMGRFGKTEISDVIAIYPMPDETVISGCEWGNILLWEEGLIKLEACQKNQKTSHSNFITQFEYFNGELISIGTDGWIKFWFYETISQADLPETEKFLEIQPIYEFYIGESRTENSMIMSLQKQEFDDPENTFWYAQDGNGGIWLLDLSTASRPEPSRKILSCHAGAILSMDIADWGPFVCTVDYSGYLHIYDYLTKNLKLVHKFQDKITEILWLPCQVEATGSTLICFFASGVLRMITIALLNAIKAECAKGDYVKLVQVLKPHTKSITAITFNVNSRLLATASQDCTIFIFNVKSTKSYPELIPIGYVHTNSPVSSATWNSKQDTILLVGCQGGECLEFELPSQPAFEDPIITYELTDCKPKGFKFKSVRSTIEREQQWIKQQQERAKRLETRKKELADLIEKNPHVLIDEEAFLMDFEEDPPLPEIYIPEVPNKVLNIGYTDDVTVWILVGGYDAGYIYEYSLPFSEAIPEREPNKSKFIGSTEEIYSYLFFNARKYLFLGTGRGEIRICKLNPDDFLDLTNYYTLNMHDCYNGIIPKLKLSYDAKLLLSCGYDGNLFSYEINDTLLEEINIPATKDPLPLPEKNVQDIENIDHPCLEEIVNRDHHKRIVETANRRKEDTLTIVNELAQQFLQIAAKNQNLPYSQRILEFEIDARITRDLEEQLQAQLDLTERKIAFKSEKSKLELQKLMDYFITPITSLPFAVLAPLNAERTVYSLREMKLDPEFEIKHFDIAPHLIEEKSVGRKTEEKEKDEEEPGVLMDIDHYLPDFADVPASLASQIKQILGKYLERKAKDEKHSKEWKKLQAKKPDLNKCHLEDSILLEETQKSIGEYKLKTAATPDINRQAKTACSKYKQLLNCRCRIHLMREDFNTQLKLVRSKKEKLHQEVLKLLEKLKKIHAEIPAKHVKPLPKIPVFDTKIEFPEFNLEPEKYISIAERMQQVKHRRQSIVIEKSVEPPDLEYEVLLLDNSTAPTEESESLSTLFSSSSMKIKSQRLINPDVMKSLRVEDSVETPWEREAKKYRVLRKIYEQECILKHIDRSYKELENELEDLDIRRLEIITESIYVDLSLSTAYQEFLVLRESEEMQTTLEEKQRRAEKEKSHIEERIEIASAKIAAKDESIRKLQQKTKELGLRLILAIGQNKFQNFLLKVYRKKYSAKKMEGSDTVSSEESTDETESTESSETGDIPLDESICPPGCDRELYDMAVLLRGKRYEYETTIKEEQKDIEALHKEIESNRRGLKLLEKNVKTCRQELEAFMLSKQRRLNDIDVTVILNFHQLQHVLDCTPEIKNCVLFDKKDLSELYARVGELQHETIGLEKKRKKNQTHLSRLKQDYQYMEMREKKLEEEIKEEMIKKFGRQISLTSIYEIVFQRMIHDAKTDLTDAMKNYDAEIKSIKDDYEQKLSVLQSLIDDNTQKLSILTVLEKEKSRLDKILRNTPISKEEMLKVESCYKKDLNKLEMILERQMEQKELLERDIQHLRSKIKPLSLSKKT